MTTQHLNVPKSSRETWRARQRGNRMRERERMRERAVDKAERKRRTGRNREGRYWPMCGGVMVAIRGSVPFVSPRAPIHHRASNHHCAMYLYTFTVCTYIYVYIWNRTECIWSYGWLLNPGAPSASRRGTLRESKHKRAQQITYIRECTTTRTSICTPLCAVKA